MKNTRLFFVLLLGCVLVSCNTTRKLYEAQQYDEVIQRLAPSISHGNTDPDDINMVANAYHKANQSDHERIQSLKATGAPEAWPEIYQRYRSMKGRNEALDHFSPRIKNAIQYAKLDLDDELTVSRNKAESYLIAKSDLLLNSGTKENAIEAEKYIVQLRHTNPESSRIQEFRQRALLHQSENVLVEFANEYGYRLPEGFETAVLAFDPAELATSHSNFYLKKVRKVDYDLLVNVVLLQVNVTPVRDDAVTFTESLGDKKAEVTDHKQSKSVVLKGQLEYYDINMGRVRFAFPFEVTSSFNHEYTVVKGNQEACSEETLRKMQQKELPVPTDESMLLDAARKLNDLLTGELTK